MSNWAAVLADCIANFDLPPPNSFQDVADLISDDYANNPALFQGPDLVYYPFPIGPALTTSSTDAYCGSAVLSLCSADVQNDFASGVLFQIEAPDLVNRIGKLWFIFTADMGTANWPPEGYPS